MGLAPEGSSLRIDIRLYHANGTWDERSAWATTTVAVWTICPLACLWNSVEGKELVCAP